MASGLTRTQNGGVNHSDEALPKFGRLYNLDSSAESPWARKVVLSLDGGGIRGYATLLILEEIMRRVESIERQDAAVTCSAAYPWSSNGEHITAGRRSVFAPHHYFDYIFGTSTGGLSAIMLGRLQLTVAEAMAKYQVVGNEVFKHPRSRIMSLSGFLIPRYPSEKMDKVLQYCTQQDVPQRLVHGPPAGGITDQDHIQMRADKVLLRDQNSDATRVGVVSFGGKAQHICCLFRSYDHPPPIDSGRDPPCKGGPTDWPLWKVGRATSAAPRFFAPVKYGKAQYKDGAMGAMNNPVSLAYDEVKQMHWFHEPSIIISIGTGIPRQQSSEDEDDDFEDTLEHKCLEYARGFLHDAEDIEQYITDSHRMHKTFQRDMNRINADLPEDKRVKFFRFDVAEEYDLPNVVGLDHWKGENGQETMEHITSAVNASLETPEVHNSLDRCAQALVALRTERAKTERWEQFALHIVYSCDARGCQAPPFTSRWRLREHAIRSHGMVWRVPCMLDENNVSYGWTCYRYQCGQERVMVFDEEEKFKMHLRDFHGILEPEILSIEGLNRWLDRCRRSVKVPKPWYRTKPWDHG